ncbi:MAG: restriction endonuclease subunit S [Flavobacteriales bacterium]|nr:restriction endonuclease subunit S [Flavobacteriales bacterium]
MKKTHSEKMKKTKNINTTTSQQQPAGKGNASGLKGEWRECKLSEIIQLGNGKERPKTYGNIPVYGGNGILGYCDSSNYFGETIIIGRVGAYCGSVYYEDKPIWVSDNALAAKPKNCNNAKFIFYLLKNLDLNSLAEGSSHPLLTQSLLNSIDVYITDSRKEQDTIAEVLSSLDDKIDLLHRQNKTLEQLAETMFNEKLKVNSEKWEEKSLDELGKIICGKTPPKKMHSYFNGSIPFIKIPDMHGNTFIFETEDSLTEEGANSQSNKFLPPMSICVSCIATVGLVSINVYPSQTNQQINSIIPFKKIYRYFLYLKMKSLKHELLAMASGGTATDNLNTGNFSKIFISVPTEDFLREFHNIVEPLFEKILSNTFQIRTLTQLRDTLLPKLMSGEIRVKLN